MFHVSNSDQRLNGPASLGAILVGRRDRQMSSSQLNSAVKGRRRYDEH